jgi:hypothetical protein
MLGWWKERSHQANQSEGIWTFWWEAWSERFAM